MSVSFSVKLSCDKISSFTPDNKSSWNSFSILQYLKGLLVVYSPCSLWIVCADNSSGAKCGVGSIVADDGLWLLFVLLAEGELSGSPAGDGERACVLTMVMVGSCEPRFASFERLDNSRVRSKSEVTLSMKIEAKSVRTRTRLSTTKQTDGEEEKTGGVLRAVQAYV